MNSLLDSGLTPNGQEGTAPQADSTTRPDQVISEPMTLSPKEHRQVAALPFELRVRELASIEYDRRHVFDRIRSMQRKKDFQAGWDACMFLHNVPPLEEPTEESEK